MAGAPFPSAQFEVQPSMANSTVGELGKQEILDCMHGLKGPVAKAEAERLADQLGLSISRVYAIAREVRPERKRRADHGKRRADLMNDPALKYAASLVVEYHIDPADAIMVARERGFEIPVSLATFQRYLREHGLDGKTRRRNITPYRSWEASAPGEIFQFDISGTKERWFDLTTRRIISINDLEVSKNHPNAKPNRVRIWRFSLLDDFSRYGFVQYHACHKPSSSHVVNFLLDAYNELGVPLKLYTDNDAIIKFGRNQRATEILSRVLADKGGYEKIHHLPGNARATGKVENSHKRVEQNEKLLGLFLAEGRELTMEVFNHFAQQQCAEYNHRVHRGTGMPPIRRWHSQHIVLRRLPLEVLRSAFLADGFTVKIRDDVTIAYKGDRYQLPTSDAEPFRNWIGQEVKVIFQDDADFFTVIGPDQNAYDVDRLLAQPDRAGDFHAVAESKGQRNRKELKRYAKEMAKAVKEAGKQGVQHPPIPLIDTTFDTSNSPVMFPHTVREISVAEIDAAAPGVLPASTAGRFITFWPAVEALQKDGTFSKRATEAEKQWLRSIFADREQITDAELKSALDSRPGFSAVVAMQRSA